MTKPKTAQEAIATHAQNPADVEDRERAKGAGVVDAAFIDYEEALHNYESRDDVETLEARRARSNGTQFGDASFRRTTEGLKEESAGVVTTDEVRLQHAVKPEEAPKRPEKPARRP